MATSAAGPVVALAVKDLRLLLRNRGAMFFALAWPVLMALFFGYVFGGGGRAGRIPVVVADEDRTPESARLVERLRATDGLEVSTAPAEEAERLVREGKRSAAVLVPAGYGEAEARLFAGAPRRLTIAVDPSRKAEAAMLEGMLTGAAMQSLQDLFTDPAAARRQVARSLEELRGAAPGPGRDRTERFLGELDRFVAAASAGGAAPGGTGGWTPLALERREVQAAQVRPRSAFEFTFPQGILWGVIGCALGFAVSLVSERTRGTLLRLEVAPLSRGHVLLGKGLACFVAIAAVEAALLGLGAAAFGVRPTSWPLLVAAAVSVAACFVGIMMLVSVTGRTEQSVAGMGWAVMMPLTMLGGGMVPLFAMPAWMQAAGVVSPVRWGILALEGALWRGLGPAELAPALAVLWGVGLGGVALGARLFRRAG